MPDNDIVSVQSRFSANETMERSLATLAERNLTVFARVDHAAGATSVGLSLRTTELIIFGNPKGGTPLMQDQQSAGIELSLKALVWEDPERKVWLSYNDPTWIAQQLLARCSQQSGSNADGGYASPNCARSRWQLALRLAQATPRGGVATETHAGTIRT